MGRYKRICFLFLCMILSLSACINTKKPSLRIEFYTLEYDPPSIGNHPPLPLVIRVERFSVASAYNSHRIIYRGKSFERAAYVYHRWQKNPGELVTQYLIRDMKNSGLFKAVLSRDSGLRSPYILEGSVEEFLEWDTEDAWEAVLTIGVVLLEENELEIGRRMLFQKSYHARKPCKQTTPRSLAESMSHAMSGISAQIIRDVYEHMKENI